MSLKHQPQPRDYISNLPLEILGKILFLSLRHFEPDVLDYDTEEEFPDPGAFRQWTPLHLSEVCKRWNKTTMTTPSLWTEWYLVIDDTEQDSVVKKILMLSSLSKGYPITIQLMFSEVTRWQGVEPLTFKHVCDVIESHSSQIHTLFLWGPEETLRALPSTFAFPALKRLEIYKMPGTVEDTDSDEHVDPIPIDAPNVVHLLLSGICSFHFTIPTQNVRTLTLHRLTPDVCASILAKTPKLERAGIYDVLSALDEFTPTYPAEVPTQIDLPRLRILDWLQGGDDDPNFTTFFEIVSAPCLEHLRWQYFGVLEAEAPVRGVLCDFVKSSPMLKSFFLRTFTEDDDDDDDFVLGLWASAEELLIVRYNPPHPILDMIPWPYPWYPEDLGSDELTSRVLHGTGWQELPVKLVLPPISPLSLT